MNGWKLPNVPRNDKARVIVNRTIDLIIERLYEQKALAEFVGDIAKAEFITEIIVDTEKKASEGYYYNGNERYPIYF